MNICDLQNLCHSFAQTTAGSIRIFQGQRLLYYFSLLNMEPDPVTPYLEEIFQSPHKAAVLTTPFFQFYGHMMVNGGYRIVIGPTCIMAEDRALLKNLTFLLNISDEEQEAYIHKLKCAPSISIDRMAWAVSFLSTAINRFPLSVSEVHVSTRDKTIQNRIAERSALEAIENFLDENQNEDVRNSYRMEQLMRSYIKNGQPEQLTRFLESFPEFKAGQMAEDTLRQIKNMGICSASVSSRAAIEGGMDSSTAFRLSDLYIQRIELSQDKLALSKLSIELMIDFAERVKAIKHGHRVESPLFEKCAQYVSRHLSDKIRVEDIAKELGFSRAYLCNQFSQQTGMTLSQYILGEKIIEAQRLLKFTDKSLTDISIHLAFSSQSHFQTVFRKITGETPAQFRQQHDAQVLKH